MSEFRIANEAKEHDKNDFTIDSKHEFAKFIIDTTEIELTDIPEFCLLSNENNCITRYEEAKYLHDEIGCENRITNNDVYYAVKTFSGYHKKYYHILFDHIVIINHIIIVDSSISKEHGDEK